MTAIQRFVRLELRQQMDALAYYAGRETGKVKLLNVKNAVIYLNRRWRFYAELDHMDLWQDVLFIARHGWIDFFDSQFAAPLHRCGAYLDVRESPFWEPEVDLRDFEALAESVGALVATEAGHAYGTLDDPLAAREAESGATCQPLPAFASCHGTPVEDEATQADAVED